MRHTLPRVFVMPDKCACCLEPAESYIESSASKVTWLVVISIRRTARVKIPYCHACRSHVELTSGWVLAVWTLVAFLVGCVGLAVLWSLASVLQSFHVVAGVLALVGLCLPLGLPIAYLVWAALRRGKPPGPGHARSGPAATLADFSDHAITLNVFNSRFLALLKLAQEKPELVIAPTPRATSIVARPTAPTTPTVAAVPRVASSENVRRRLASLPRNAPPEKALRFVASRCEIVNDGLVTSLPDGTSRKVAWADIASIYARRLPHDPPWDRALVMDLAPVDGPPVRLLSATDVNFHDLPAGGASLFLENCQRLGAHVVENNPNVEMDPETRAFITGFGPCAALSGIAQFLRYDDRYPDTP